MLSGYAMQCRVTTEDPTNKFLPDYGRLTHYRSASGMGIRLDAGTAFPGAVITPFYDSLLVKVTAEGRRFVDAARRMERCLQEFRVRGVKTNMPFLINLVTNPGFLAGAFTTGFIDQTAELYNLPVRQDRASKLLSYIGEVIVNGDPEISAIQTKKVLNLAAIPRDPLRIADCGLRIESQDQPAGVSVSSSNPQSAIRNPQLPLPQGTRDRFREIGAEHFCQWLRDQKPLFLTDTTFRDAHQSLLATRMRTYDMLRIAAVLRPASLRPLLPRDVGRRHLRHLHALPQGIALAATCGDAERSCRTSFFRCCSVPPTRSATATIPTTSCAASSRKPAQAGIDLFRIFDAINWLPNLQVAMEAVRDADMLCEAAICYTGDILDPRGPSTI